jgi:signal transduction histidine kinase
MSSRLSRVVWQGTSLVLVVTVLVVLAEAGVVRPWVGVIVAAIVTVLVVLLPGRRDLRFLRAIRERAERAVSLTGGSVVRHAGNDVDRVVSAVLALIKAVESEGRARAASDRDLSAILSTLGEGVVIADTTGNILVVNDAARVMLDSGSGTDLTRSPASLRRLVHDIATGAAMVTEVFEHGHPERWLQATVRPLDDRRALIVLRDVTAHRRVARMRRDFVADASHELKTPVAAILAASETINSALPGDLDAAEAFAERLHVEALRLAALVSDLLDLSRLEAASPAMEVVGLADILRTEVQERAQAFAEAGIHVECSLTDVKVRANPREVALAVGNLLENARSYSNGDSSVDVRVSAEDDRGVVTVTDEGTGIPARDLPRIFERFYRVDAARSRRSGGTGLGLAIVKHVAERHGGGVEVESEFGVGSTFRFWLPRV